jgi:hypothetical protein
MFAVLTIGELAKFTGSLGVLVAVNLVAWPGLAWYGLAALRRAYADSWPRTIVKGAVLGVMFLIAWLLAMVALLIWTVWF